MATQQTIDVTDYIDKRKLNAFNFQLVVVSFLVIMVDGFDITVAAFAVPPLIAAWGIADQASSGRRWARACSACCSARRCSATSATASAARPRSCLLCGVRRLHAGGRLVGIALAARHPALSRRRRHRRPAAERHRAQCRIRAAPPAGDRRDRELRRHHHRRLAARPDRHLPDAALRLADPVLFRRARAAAACRRHRDTACRNRSAFSP